MEFRERKIDSEAFLEHLNNGKTVISGGGAHLCVRGVSREALRLAAEMICFAAPVYCYEISGQMKTLPDRANSLYSAITKRSRATPIAPWTPMTAGT